MEVIDVYVDSYTATPYQSAASSVSSKSYTAESSSVSFAEQLDAIQQSAHPQSDGEDTNIDEELTAADNEKIKKALENIEAQLPNSVVKFGIHEETNRVTIKLVDKDTDEVIKEFPPEKTLDMIAKCMEIAGVLVDEKT
jgi:flagellar protein FlaG